MNRSSSPCKQTTPRRRKRGSRRRFERLEQRRLLAGPSLYVGTNLDGVRDWGATAFVDVMNEARDWQTANSDGSGGYNTNLSASIPLGANGWPTHVPFDAGGGNPLQIVHSVIPVRGPGTYRLIAQGTGTIRFRAADGLLDPTTPFTRSVTVNLTGGEQTFDLVVHDSAYGDGIGSLFMYVDSSDSLDPVREMDLVMPGHESTYTTNPFAASYTDDLEPFVNLRFMDWGSTNFNPTQTWSDRTTPVSHTQTRSQGVSLEYMVALANELDQNPWFTIPAEADDTFVQNTATYIRDNLNANLKVFVEYSNETWNGIFNQTQYVQTEGLARGLDTNAFAAGQKYVSLRSAQIWGIFEQVFAAGSADRLIKVMASQSANTFVTTTRLDALLDPSINPDGIMPDALAIAPYFGGPVADQIASEGIVDTITIEQILDRVQSDLILGSTVDVANQKAIADDFGLWLINYEGGQHLVATGANKENQALTDKLIAANRDPRMYDLYTDYLDMLRDADVALHSNFSYTGGPSKHGSWGILEDQDQPHSEAHKYRAIIDWIAANPPGNRPPTARSGNDIQVFDDGDGLESITLDATASRDFDGSLVGYEWKLDGVAVGNDPVFDVDVGVGVHAVQLIVTDDAGESTSDWLTVTVAPQTASQALVESDFAGAPPPDLIWDQTLQLNSNVEFSGWTLGNGLTNNGIPDAIGHFTNFGSVEADLTYALSNDLYQSFTVNSSTDQWLDLRGAQFQFTIQRLDYHGGRRYAVMSSVGGFDAANVLYDTERFTTTTPESFEFTLPFAGFHTDQAIEFRIYVYEGQYANKDSSLTGFALFGATSPPDTRTPGISLLRVADDSVDVAVDTDLVVTFDELIQAAAGNVLIQRRSDGFNVQTVDVQSSAVTVIGANLIIDLPDPLEAETEYSVLIYADAVEDLAGNGFAGIIDTAAWNFTTAAPPTVLRVDVNGGQTQRSAVTDVTVTFDHEVEIDFSGESPFSIINTTTNQVVVAAASVSSLGGRTVVDIAFLAGASVNASGSLLDGNYALTIDASRIFRKGLLLDGDGDGNVGGNHVFVDHFYRKYGDLNGNDLVDLLDFAAFRRAFGLTQGAAGYEAALDSDDDDTIGLLDFTAFRRNFGT